LTAGCDCAKAGAATIAARIEKMNSFIRHRLHRFGR
jgi:IS1 family transposase